MKYRLHVRPAAQADIDELALFIARDSLEQALRFYDALADTFKAIVHHPTRHPLYGFSDPALSEVRKRGVERFSNYLVFYRVIAETVEVVRVLHGARDLPRLMEDPS
jgi:toxin ParE1/3/4